MWLNIICMTIWYCYYIGRYTNINTYRPRDHERKKDNFGQRPTLPLQANVESWSVTIFHKINALQVASKMEQFWQEYIILCSAQGSVGSLRKFFPVAHIRTHKMDKSQIWKPLIFKLIRCDIHLVFTRDSIHYYL